MTIQPNNPFAVSLPPGSAPTNESGDRGGGKYTQDYHGRWYAGSYYNRVFSFNVTAVTLPVIAATLASKASLYNPPQSTVNLELIAIDVGSVVATDVVDVVGIYWQGPTLASLATLTTIGVFGTNWFAGNTGGNAGQGNPYSALTHSGTPVRIDIVSFFGATTTTAAAADRKEYDGRKLFPPGHVMSVAMSTAASTATGIDIGIEWQEVPLT